MKKKYAYGFLAICGLVLAGCTTGANKTDDSGAAEGTSGTPQEFNVIVQQEMPTADLSVATDTISFSAINNVFEGIYRLDKDSVPQPAGAAEKAEVSEDGLTYKVKLREDAKWSNGDPVTAADYVYGWQRTVSPETASEYASMFEVVANGKEIAEGSKKPEELGIKAVGDYELEITLSKATPYFDYLLAFPSFFPLHQATVEEFGDKYAATSDNAVYNGPFTLDGFDGPGTDTEWNYVKNDNYWDKDTVKLDQINVSVVKESNTSLNLFQDGQADDVILTGELAQQMQNDPAYIVQQEATTYYLELNQREEDSPYRNADLRKAISYAIDRDSLVNAILGDGSLAAVGLVPEKMTFNPTNGKDFTEEAGSVLEYNPEKAKEHWEKAKKELGIETLEAELLASDTDSTKKLIEYLKDTLEKNLDGFSVNLSPVPFSVRLDRSNAGEFDLVSSGWGADYADASSFTNLFVTGNSYNRGGYSNPEYDKIVDAANNEHANDPEKRWEDLVKAEQTIMADQGVIPVYQKAEAHMRAEKVKGVVAHAAGAQYDYKWVTIEE
ncbi:MAG TPA: peptide ABC transporter substrate-binding protein [Enterococcus sp.]|nr:peptide ABC transporter substrate-binding protein [Enterococcus sp.]